MARTPKILTLKYNNETRKDTLMHNVDEVSSSQSFRFWKDTIQGI